MNWNLLTLNGVILGRIRRPMFKGIFISRKFYAAIIGILILGIGAYFKLDQATVAKFEAIIIAYILGTGLSDSGMIK